MKMNGASIAPVNSRSPRENTAPNRTLFMLRIISLLSKLENVIIINLFRSDDDGRSSAAMQ